MARVLPDDTWIPRFCPGFKYPDLQPLPPDYTDIHPMMPEQLQDDLRQVCELANINFRDREKVWNALRNI